MRKRPEKLGFRTSFIRSCDIALSMAANGIASTTITQPHLLAAEISSMYKYRRGPDHRTSRPSVRKQVLVGSSCVFRYSSLLLT